MIVSLAVVLIATAVMLGLGLLAVASWFFYTAYLTRRERRLAVRKGLYRDLVGGLATRERALLEPAIRQLGTLHDLEALEAVLEEQARSVTERPGWLLDAYDRLGLVDKYIEHLRHSRRWRERAFAAELLGRVGNAKAVAVLLETAQATKTEDADVREIALRALARIADPRAVGPLVETLKQAEGWLAPRIADILVRHGDLVVDPLIEFLGAGGRNPARAWAANVLGELRAVRAFPALLRALADLDEEVRGKSATALGRLGDRRAVPPLLEHLLSDPAPFVRARVAAALGQFGGPEVTDRLVRALGDAAWWVRMRSVEALEQIGPGAERPLLFALDDMNPEVRIRAAAALERLGVPARLVRRIEEGDRPEEAVETLVKFAVAGARELLAELLVHPATAVRLAVITAIRRAGREDLAAELTTLAQGQDTAQVRAEALKALEEVSTPAPASSRASAFTTTMHATLDARERLRLVAEFGAAAGALGRAALQQVVQGDPSPEVRAAALGVLGGMLEDEPLVDTARRALGDPNRLVRHAGVALFRAVPPERALPELVRLVRADDDPVVLTAVAEHAETAFVAFGELVRAVDPAGREAVTVVRAARHIRHAGLAPLFAPLARSRAPEVRAELATLWAARPDLADPMVVEGLVGDPVVAVRRAALRAAMALRRYDLVTRLVQDPDASVRLEVAWQLQGTDHVPVPAALHDDPSEQVRAAAYVARLLRGELLERPADVPRAAAASAVQTGARLEDLRATARTAPDPRHRLSAALALALLGDEAAREVAADDPVPAIRTAVAGELARHDGAENRDGHDGPDGPGGQADTGREGTA